MVRPMLIGAKKMSKECLLQLHSIFSERIHWDPRNRTIYVLCCNLPFGTFLGHSNKICDRNGLEAFVVEMGNGH